ncbi:Methyltransferase [Datura stramonium]|uniref:Methyltransferase n=1 Tax=Datura stramonium TaxID=4076 RepID=A0ABS8T3P6_DATST|nr:Methyltransferase [Datura stramonium]
MKENELSGGDALPGSRSYKGIGEIANKMGSEVVKEKDLAKPSMEPWWTRLKMGRIAYLRNRVVMIMLSWLGITPEGVIDVHDILFVTADYLAKGPFNPAKKSFGGTKKVL